MLVTLEAQVQISAKTIDLIINLDRTPYTAEMRHLVVVRRNVIGRRRNNDAIIDLLTIIQVFCS